MSNTCTLRDFVGDFDILNIIKLLHLYNCFCISLLKPLDKDFRNLVSESTWQESTTPRMYKIKNAYHHFSQKIRFCFLYQRPAHRQAFLYHTSVAILKKKNRKSKYGMRNFWDTSRSTLNLFQILISFLNYLILIISANS